MRASLGKNPYKAFIHGPPFYVHPTFTSDVIQVRPSPKSQFTVFSKAENLDSSKKPFLLSYDSSIHFIPCLNQPLDISLLPG